MKTGPALARRKNAVELVNQRAGKAIELVEESAQYVVAALDQACDLPPVDLQERIRLLQAQLEQICSMLESIGADPAENPPRRTDA